LIMRTLNDFELKTVENAVGCAVHFASMVRLYSVRSGQWQQDGMGAITIFTDTSANSHFLKFVDLNSKSVKFSQELYNNFEYAKPKDFFHTFEADEHVVGLSFADVMEATDFYNKVQYCKNVSPSNISSGSPLKASVPSSSYRTTTNFAPSPPITPTPTPTATTPNTPNSANQSGITRKPTSFFSLFKKDQKEDDLLISEPSNFRHVSSIGWNPNEASFEIRNIPPEWRKLFQAAGIKKSELKNKDTAAMIRNIIEEHGGAEAFTTPAAPPAPSISHAPSRPPAPVPHRGNDSHGAPPPAPPPPAPSSGGGVGRASLLESIHKGTSLKHVDKEEEDDRTKAPAPPSGLADTLARAMESRRAAIKEDHREEEEWSDEWSDNE